uniref:RXLR4 n=1 Tax=Albugo laibachii Nc14 TaxID=890382 RepID=F0WNP5_9STRA|nr:RXLR4 [Albugo laibachii Nc14]|eukprot:CCA22936.1 RXLR4 [Albugo laibachii Nc14]
MKLLSFKTVVVAVLGAFPAPGDCLGLEYVELIPTSSHKSGVLTRRGLRAHISPDLEFSDENSLKETNKVYSVTFVVKPEKDTLKNVHQIVTPNEHKTSALAGGVDEANEEQYLESLLIAGTYTTAWRLGWKTLKKLVLNKNMTVYPVTPAMIVIDPLYYTEKYDGIYTFERAKEGDYRLYFGDINPSAKFMPETELPSTSIQFGFLPPAPGQIIKFNFGMEFSGIPLEAYNELSRWLEVLGFSETGGLYHTKRKGLYKHIKCISKEEKQFMVSTHPDTAVMRFLPVHYIVAKGNTGVAELFSNSKKDIWEFGCSFLGGESVIVKSTQGQKSYKFANSEATN